MEHDWRWWENVGKRSKKDVSIGYSFSNWMEKALFWACIRHRKKDAKQHKASDAHWSTTRAAAFFLVFSISTHFHPKDAIASQWSGWKQQPDDDNAGHLPIKLPLWYIVYIYKNKNVENPMLSLGKQATVQMLACLSLLDYRSFFEQ